MNDMDSYFPSPDQNTNNLFQPDLSWDDWLSGLTNEPDFNASQNCPLPNNAALRCPSLDSNASSKLDQNQMLDYEWPAPVLEDLQFKIPPPCSRVAGILPDIESCIPQSTPYHSPTEEHPPTNININQPQASANTKKISPSVKRNRTSQTKPEPPSANDPSKKAASNARTAHSVIEHNYRKNLNDKMEQLRQVLSTANVAERDSSGLAPGGASDADDRDLTSSSTRVRKSDVLIHAFDYVKRSEKEKKNMMEENAFLKRRLVALEKLVKCEDCSLLEQMKLMQIGASRGSRV